MLHADAMSVLFVALSTLLWLVTTVYAIGYLEHSPHRSRFFGFFSLCVSATVGLALAGNLVTFVIFYELLTLATYPLVAHRGTPDALRARASTCAIRWPAARCCWSARSGCTSSPGRSSSSPAARWAATRKPMASP